LAYGFQHSANVGVSWTLSEINLDE